MIRILAAIGALCIFCSVLLALFIVARIVRSRSDPYPPEAAEAPKGDDVMAVANAAGLPKPIYAGSDLDGDLPTGMLTELYEAIDAYKRGEFIEADAPKEWA